MGRVGWERFGWLDAGDYTTGSGGCQEKCGKWERYSVTETVTVTVSQRSRRVSFAVRKPDVRRERTLVAQGFGGWRHRSKTVATEGALGELTRADSQVASGSHMDTSSGRGSRVGW